MLHCLGMTGKREKTEVRFSAPDDPRNIDEFHHLRSARQKTSFYQVQGTHWSRLVPPHQKTWFYQVQRTHWSELVPPSNPSSTLDDNTWMRTCLRLLLEYFISFNKMLQGASSPAT